MAAVKNRAIDYGHAPPLQCSVDRCESSTYISLPSRRALFLRSLLLSAMSSPEPCNTEPEPISDFNNVYYESLSEKNIAEVKKRPSLYDTTMRTYNDRTEKVKLWNEVCAAIDSNWEKMAEYEKRTKSDLIQKRWKNIRDSLSKELTMQKKKSVNGVIKKKKYVHYDSLSFLVPFIRKREMNSNVSSDHGDGEPLSPPQVLLHEEDSNPQTVSRNIYSQGQSSDDDYEQIIIKNVPPSKHNTIDFDEDINFSKMIVPMLRKLNDGQKHYAKVEILNILQKAKYYSPFVQVPSPQTYQNVFSSSSRSQILVTVPIKQEQPDPLSENNGD